MNQVYDKKELEDLIASKPMVLIYFGGEGCGVCTVIKPDIEKMLKDYPEAVSAEVKVDKSAEICAAYNIFTIPAVLLFIEGKETIRQARFIDIQELDSRIGRYYGMIFG